MKKLFAIMSVILCMAFVFCACGGGETPDSTPDSTPTAESTPNSTPESTPAVDSIPESTPSSTPTVDSIPDSTPSSTPTVDSTPDSTPESNVPSDKVKYTIKVVDQNNNPVANAYVQVCQGETCFSRPISTDANGEAYMELNPQGGQVKMQIIEIDGGGYTFESEYTYFNGTTQKTITVVKVEKVNYTVNVVDGNGTPIADVVIQVCQGETCFARPIVTDANGVAVKELDKSQDVKVKIVEIEAGNYSYSSEYIYFENDEEITIVVKELFEYKVTLQGVLEGVKVRLYDKATGFLITSKTSDATGIVVFSNMEAGSYYVTVESTQSGFVAPDYNGEDGISFEDGSFELTINCGAQE